ncbi:hypothetical protein ANO14919_014710 [Xylariales sp. No.14919]|nr:hypothetical protein ANO14919_014710 [Xylariales sp. No.14919]
MNVERGVLARLGGCTLRSDIESADPELSSSALSLNLDTT